MSHAEVPECPSVPSARVSECPSARVPECPSVQSPVAAGSSPTLLSREQAKYADYAPIIPHKQNGSSVCPGELGRAARRMEDEALEARYAELSGALDARAVLRYLNQLGIRNVSGAALRDFITDLKKLIKYDLQCKSKNVEEDSTEVRGPERLHSASTFCSRTRSRRTVVGERPTVACSRECRKGRENARVKSAASAPSLRPNPAVAPARRSCSCTRVGQPETKKKRETQPKKVLISSTNLIKVPIAPPQKKSDPVSLYHYYLALWDKYKSNVPGENSWAELRWSIRQKLAGEIQKPVPKKMTALTAKELEKRREGWVE